MKTKNSSASTAVPKIRVLIVEDHPMMRRGLRAQLELMEKFEVCGETDNAAEALVLARELDPALALVDLTLKSTNGIDLTQALRVQSPALRILIVSAHDEQVYAERALRAGAMGYVMKHETGAYLIAAIECVLAGGLHVSAGLKEKLLHRFLNKSPDSARTPSELLSVRELEILKLIGAGNTTRVIAAQLGLSAKTVDSHRENLKSKLRLGSSPELVRYAVQWARAEGEG